MAERCSTVTVGPCPFCGNELYRSPRAHNPKAYCVTEDCYGKRMSVVNLDDPVCVAMWNARAGCGGGAQAAPMPWPSREIVAREIRRAMLDNPTAGTFNKREAERERVADDAADAILARFEQSRAQPTQGGDKGEAVAWRYKCKDGSEVLMLKRLTDEQKRRGYYTGEDGEDEVDGDEAIVGPFHWAEETPLYAAPQPASNAYSSQQPSPETIRAAAKDAIRTFCNSQSPAAVQMSHGVERIYYAGLSLDALAVAVALALPSTQNATPSGTGGPGPVVADQHAAANTPATSHSSTPREAPHD